MVQRERTATAAGVEYLVDVYGCDAEVLRSCERLSTIVARIIRETGVRPIRGPLWQQFPEPGGITGLWLLAESHLAVHTYPEGGFAAFNLYCCGTGRPWAWDTRLRQWLGAEHVDVRTVTRGSAHAQLQAAAQSGPDRIFDTSHSPIDNS